MNIPSLILGPLLISQLYPDQSDILRTVDTTPQIQLLLDSSCSMGWDPAPSICEYYATTRSAARKLQRGSFRASNGTWYLVRLDQLKAALTGCRSTSDGILDLWNQEALFSVREFGGNRKGIVGNAVFNPDGQVLDDLENAVLRLPASGGTPLAPAYQISARYFQNFFNDDNSSVCRQNHIVVMSDGEGNSSGRVSFNFVPGQPNLSVRDARNLFWSCKPVLSCWQNVS